MRAKKIQEELAGLKIINQDLYDLAYGLDFLANVCRLCEEAQEADPERKTDLSSLAQKVQNTFYLILDVLYHHTQNLAEEMQKSRFELTEALETTNQEKSEKEADHAG